jgi:hypothetical protein
MIESPEGGGELWDAIWESAGKRTDEGYVVEMAIPLTQANRTAFIKIGYAFVL